MAYSSVKIDSDVTNMVERIVEVAQPQRVILFGSFAEGAQRPDSDLDFLIVIRDNCRPAQVTDELYARIRHRQWPCDFVVTTSSELARHAQNPGLIYKSILQQGIEMYAD